MWLAAIQCVCEYIANGALLLFFFLIVRCNCLIIDFWHISHQQKKASNNQTGSMFSVMKCNGCTFGGSATECWWWYILQRVLSVLIVCLCVCVCSPFVPFLLMRRIGFLWALSFVQSHIKPFHTLTVCVCVQLFCCLISFEFFFWCSSTQRSEWIKSNFDCIIKSVPPF